LELVAPTTWNFAVGLPETRERDEHPSFQAGDYDMLVDNLVTMGVFVEEQ